jgi:ubiquinone/menaquinone biosynthesis C-methylase UbiE
MGFYDERVLPYLVHLAMRQEALLPYRQRVVQAAHGQVLEIGVGSGLNLPLYGGAARHVTGLDTSPRLLSMAQHSHPGSAVVAELIEASAEALPFENQSIDTVVSTWTLCSIPAVGAALAEMRRVLKPAGELRFVEHGRAPETTVRLWQDRLTPVWKRLAGGCHLNRPIPELLEEAGFRVERLETGYMKGPKPMTFMYEGQARPR